MEIAAIHLSGEMRGPGTGKLKRLFLCFAEPLLQNLTLFTFTPVNADALALLQKSSPKAPSPARHR